MSTYTQADTRTQWFADNYPGANTDPNCGVLHTTEGTGWPDYGGGKSAPNYTARPDFTSKRLVWRAHFPDEMSSRALMNQPGGVDTNTANVVNVELVGTCDPKHAKSWNGEGRYLAGTHYIFWPAAPDWAKRDLAAFMSDMHTRHGIPLQGPATWLPYPKSYGSTSGQRMTFAQWREFRGWCGHQHVPENDHGDPGSLDFAGILALAKGATLTPPEEDFMDVKNPVTGEPWPAEKALWSIWTYALNASRDAAVARKLAEAQAKAARPLTAAEIDDIARATVTAMGADYDAQITLTPKES